MARPLPCAGAMSMWLDELIVSLSPASRPRVCYIPASGRRRPRRRERGRELLVRVQRHGLVRARARSSPRRTRNPVRQLLPTLRWRGAAPTGLLSARRRRASGRTCRRRRCSAALRRHGAAGGGRVPPGRAGVSRRTRERKGRSSRGCCLLPETFARHRSRRSGVCIAFERSCRGDGSSSRLPPRVWPSPPARCSLDRRWPRAPRPSRCASTLATSPLPSHGGRCPQARQFGSS